MHAMLVFPYQGSSAKLLDGSVAHQKPHLEPHLHPILCYGAGSAEAHGGMHKAKRRRSRAPKVRHISASNMRLANTPQSRSDDNCLPRSMQVSPGICLT